MSKQAELLSAQPALKVEDVERAYDFYAKLGFTKHFQNQELHLLIQRDGVILHLATQWVASPSGCQIVVSDIEAIYAQAREAELPIKFDIQNEFWGCRDFTVEDPDGNFVTFSQPIPS